MGLSFFGSMVLIIAFLSFILTGLLERGDKEFADSALNEAKITSKAKTVLHVDADQPE